ncbi:MAG: ribonuclease P protein component [Microbacteriaceae bacterium]
MLAKSHRITRGDDYRNAVRRGARFGARHTVMYLSRNRGGADIRFGFIVSKAVGNAVQRNRVRRRLKSIAWQLRDRLEPGTDVVIRALPASALASWSTLQEEVFRAVSKGGVRL